MLDYIFFHHKPRDLFAEFLNNQGLKPVISEEDEGSYEVSIADDIDDSICQLIDARYDDLFEMNRELFEKDQSENEPDYGGASVVVALSNGTFSYADVDPALLNKILQVISTEELGAIVAAIADAVENPQTRSYCQRLRDEN